MGFSHLPSQSSLLFSVYSSSYRITALTAGCNTPLLFLYEAQATPVQQENFDIIAERKGMG